MCRGDDIRVRSGGFNKGAGGVGDGVDRSYGSYVLPGSVEVAKCSCRGEGMAVADEFLQ